MRCAERVSVLEPIDMFIKRQYCPFEQTSPNRVLVCLVCGWYEEQLCWSGPGSTLWHMEREAAEQMGGVHSSTYDIVDERDIVHETPFLQAADVKPMQKIAMRKRVRRPMCLSLK